MKDHQGRLPTVAKQQTILKNEVPVIPDRDLLESLLHLAVGFKILEIRSDHQLRKAAPLERAGAYQRNAIGNRERPLLSGRELPQRIALFAILASRPL